ncbi:C40 family peptidase [Dictyobacter arantiisoli]|nr:C40 family peptidase [Dictyobacter arantiisoli]
MTQNFIIASGVVDIHSEPDSESELVTQALMNMPAIADEDAGDWTHITLPDYSGWIETRLLELPIVRGVCEGGEGTCGVALPYSVVVQVTHASVYTHAEGEETLFDIYLSTVLPYIDLSHPQRVRIALPGDEDGWIERQHIEIRNNDELYPLQDLSVVAAHARSFLDVPYLWGGNSWEGIDCSGFVQLCYRMGGNIIPRDADQQHDSLSQTVVQSDMRVGDLIFFGSKSITHVAMALNEHEYIHAEGQRYNRVIINSFDPQQPHYDERLAQIVWDIKRVR